jgi:DNA-binding transcriptional ArsR family regulator
MTFMPPLKPQINTTDAHAALVCLGSKPRLFILESIAYMDNECTVDYIQEITRMSYQSIYQHLQKMEACGLLESCRDGRERYYAIREDTLRQLTEWFGDISRHIRTSVNYS